jgi:DNA modification methylase
LKHADVFTLIKDIPDKSIDMIFADPPYNLSGAGFLTVKN